MARGAALQSIYVLNISKNYNKDIKILASSIQSKKTIYTHFLGSEDLSTETNPDGNIDIKPDQSRIDKILNLPIPQNKEGVQSLLGL